MLDPARVARNEGIDRALDAESEAWKQLATRYLIDLVKPGWEGLFEDIRLALTAAGLPKPHTPEVWGGMTYRWIKLGLLDRVGNFDHPKDRPSHASQKQILRRTEETIDMLPLAFLTRHYGIFG